MSDEELPLLDLESRLLVALSARGPLRMGQIIAGALVLHTDRDVLLLSDEEFVTAVERVVFGEQP